MFLKFSFLWSCSIDSFSILGRSFLIVWKFESYVRLLVYLAYGQEMLLSSLVRRLFILVFKERKKKKKRLIADPNSFLHSDRKLFFVCSHSIFLSNCWYIFCCVCCLCEKKCHAERKEKRFVSIPNDSCHQLSLFLSFSHCLSLYFSHSKDD